MRQLRQAGLAYSLPFFLSSTLARFCCASLNFLLRIIVPAMVHSAAVVERYFVGAWALTRISAGSFTQTVKLPMPAEVCNLLGQSHA